MARVLRDRYFAYDRLHGCDLATGEAVRLDNLPEEANAALEPALAPLIEVLDHGREGDPRWVVADARNAVQAAAIARRAAAQARRRGFVPVLVDLYGRLWDAMADDLRERALLLIGHFASGVPFGRAALVRAAAHSPRPHVLMTFCSSSTARSPMLVREARAVYGAQHAVRPSSTTPHAADIERHIERGNRAFDFQRIGRHAAGERLLRDVSAALARRHALVPAAAALVALGRLLLERGRANDAEQACDEAARLAPADEGESVTLDARLWQVAARTDAGRLTEAESLCRAVLLAGSLPPLHHAWAHALLARILLWQGRIEEAARVEWVDPEESTSQADEAIAAFTGATSVRVRLCAGDVFGAGQRARALLARTEHCADPLPRLMAHVAHLRLLVATGDLALAWASFSSAIALGREARAPLRAARARAIWHDALRRAGRMNEATRELAALGRIAPASPPLLRRSINERIAAGESTPSPMPVSAVSPVARASSLAVTLLRLAHDEESETKALRRILERVALDLQASRVELLSADAGPVSTLMTTGMGLPTHLGPRVLEAGIVLPAEIQHGGREVGMPVRLGSRLLAALVCRWPLDREPPAHAVEVLELAAAVGAPRLDAQLAEARETARASASIPELVGAGQVMADLRRAIERAAGAPFSVLIEGESGTGKELVARAIHQLGPRRERRFCDINCAALPDELLESELFGHARGAFTGAVADRAGLFEDADGGTLFLDEMPDLSPRGQAKLLRVLQQHEVRRLGETFSRKVDVRLVTATNRDMQTEVAAGRFRRDLLYRLDVIRIRIPPLRDRPEDVPLLAEHFWRAAAMRVGSTASLTHGVLSDLARYHWPGNVRELQNVMAALAVAAPSRGRVRSSLLPSAITGATAVTSRRLSDARAQFERRCVEVALARAGGSRTRAAADLGLSRQGLLKTMARLGIE